MTTTNQQILSELRLLKKAIANLVGTADLPDNKQLDSSSLDKAANNFSACRPSVING